MIRDIDQMATEWSTSDRFSEYKTKYDSMAKEMQQQKGCPKRTLFLLGAKSSSQAQQKAPKIKHNSLFRLL